jgi:hypothetical protein
MYEHDDGMRMSYVRMGRKQQRERQQRRMQALEKVSERAGSFSYADVC